MTTASAILNELEAAVAGSSSDHRRETLRRATDLFLNQADRLNDQQIAVFDDVLLHLVRQIETRTLAELSNRLAPISRAPVRLSDRLAHHEEIAVAGPVLSQSGRLSDASLLNIAKSAGQPHLLAISGRRRLNVMVTDVLIERGNSAVAHRLADNAGAQFSRSGYENLARRAEADEILAEKLSMRLDMPMELLRDLLCKAAAHVRDRVLAAVNPALREKAEEILAGVAQDVSSEASAGRNFEASDKIVCQLNRLGKLNENVLLEFARKRQYEEMASALALLCSAPVALIERLMKNIDPDGLLVACKAVPLKWETVEAILQARFAHHTATKQELTAAINGYAGLTEATAQRTLRFLLVQNSVKGQPAA